MSGYAYAKLPSAWVRKGDAEQEPPYGGLSKLPWQRNKSYATAALLILFALAILSNKAQRKDGLRKDDQVKATYEEIQEVTNLSRKLISGGLKLLKEIGVISEADDGARSVYRLHGIDEGGKWCQLPQGHLLNNVKHMQRLKLFGEQIKRATSLHALKVYMLLLAFREIHSNATRMSYEKIMEYTGMRREDVALAVQVLATAQLCRQATDEEIPRRKGDAMHNRYLILGLKAS